MFFRNLRNENKSERTICQYAYDIRGFFDYLSTTSGFKNKNLNSLKINEILDKLEKEDLQEEKLALLQWGLTPVKMRSSLILK